MESSFSDKLSELLHHYDCVIVPELGGFVTNYRPARIDKGLNLIHPPSKELSFNKNLNRNDGILADAISQAESISHEEANSRIKKEVEGYFNALHNKERVVFEKVGILYFDKEKRMQFSPDESVNYLIESYGLKKIHAAPETALKPIEKPVVEEPALVPIVKEPAVVTEPLPLPAPVVKREKVAVEPAKKTEPTPRQPKEEETPIVSMRPRKWYWAAALIPLFLYLGLVADKSNVIDDGDVQWADFNLFKKDIRPVYDDRGERPLPETELLEAFVIEEPLTEEYASNVTEEPEVKEEAVVAIEVEDAAPVSTYVAPSEVAMMEFHVIAGCFAERANAIKMVDKLKAKGYPSFIIQQRKGLHYVSYGSFSDRALATDFLRRMKEEEDAQAWLYRKR